MIDFSYVTAAALFATLATTGTSQQRLYLTSNAPPANGHALARDDVRGRTVLFGGGRFENSSFPVFPQTQPTDETWEWDGAWVALAPPTTPPPRQAASMAFDSDRSVTFMFGGEADGTALDDTWTWDGTDWSEPAPTTRPTARAGAAIAHDRARSRTVLFGGQDGATTLGDTWEWDGSDWTLRNTTSSPPAVPAVMAFDAARAEVILVNLLAETWAWDGVDWSRRTPATPLSIGLRRLDSMTYDAARARIVLVGDQILPPGNVTWEWDGVDWMSRTPSGQPTARGARTAYDAVLQRVIAYGGFYPTQPFEPTELAHDVTIWDGTNWTLHEPRQYPISLFRHAMAYDPAAAEIVMFGGAGRREGLVDDTWIWDGTRWVLRQPSHRPAARFDHAMALDANGALIVFGGRSAATTLDDTWAWDGTDWAPLTLPQSPPARQDHAMAFDSTRGELVLFGGTNGSTTFTDTWIWDGANWRQRTSAHAPPPMSDPAMVYDAGLDHVLLVGSGGGSWEWDGVDWRLSSTSSGLDPTLAYDSRRDVVYSYDGSGMSARNGAGFTTMAVLAPPGVRPGSAFDAAIAYHAAADQVVAFGGVLVGGLPPATRTFNETVVLEPAEPALYSAFGVGCAGSSGTLTMRSNDDPLLGTSFTISIDDLPLSRLSVPFGVLGFSAQADGALTLPFDLTPVGMTGCSLYVRSDATPMLTSQSGQAFWNLTIPSDANLLGTRFYTQCFVIDARANPLGVIASNAGAARIGTQPRWRRFP